jgi:hypothetical protein
MKIENGSESDSVSSAYSQRWVSLISLDRYFLLDFIWKQHYLEYFMLTMCLKTTLFREGEHISCVLQKKS